MSAQGLAEKSVFQTVLIHGGLSLMSFGLIGAGIVGAVNMFGDAGDAGPSVEIALFERHDGPKPVLKHRLTPDVSSDDTKHAAADLEDGQPSLPVDDPYGGYVAETKTSASGVTITKLDETHIKAPSAQPEAAPEPIDVADRLPLPKAPIVGFYEQRPIGKLPVIAEDGRTPAEVYSRPHIAGGKPQVSLIIGGLGLNRRVTQAAIDELPAGVTLSFVPYAGGLQTWIDRARAAGHEVLLELPMEPYDYPNNDTGPHTLLTSASADENARRLEILLGQATGYFGVTNYQGAKFATETRAAEPVVQALKDRGLVFIHDGASPRSVFPAAADKAEIGFAVADRIVDAKPAADAIDQQLLHLEAIALQDGHAVGAGFAYPVTVDQFRLWTESLEYKGFELVPASMAAGVDAAVSGENS
ncbi:MAG: divergent polysaccharide deacetylase family protein [Pseudomonadota bacterium]